MINSWRDPSGLRPEAGETPTPLVGASRHPVVSGIAFRFTRLVGSGSVGWCGRTGRSRSNDGTRSTRCPLPNYPLLTTKLPATHYAPSCRFQVGFGAADEEAQVR